MEFIKALSLELLTILATVQVAAPWHGLAWLPDIQDVEQLLVDTSDD